MKTRRGGAPPFLEAVVRTLSKYRMLGSGERVLVGVSGGPDSTALLHVLADLRGRYRCSLHVAHLHHGLRGEEADRDAEFVRKTAESLDFPLILERIDAAEAARRERLSLQAGARKVRYEFFRRAAEKTGCSRIAVGHTADDQAETVLMRLLRGAGPRGLGGIPPVRGPVIRPLIEARREEILAYLSEGGYPWMEDSSNLRPVSLRNRIRLELIPRLREYNPNLVPRLAGIAGVLRDEDRMLDDYAAGLLPGFTIREWEGGLLLEAGRLGLLPVPIQRRLVRLAGERLCGRRSPWSLQQTERVAALIRGGEGPKGWTLPGGIRADRLPEGLWLRRKGEGGPAAGFSVEVPVPGTIEVDPPGIRVATRIVEGPIPGPSLSGVEGMEGEDRWTARFDPATFSAPIRIRSRREGDGFSPRGMGGRRQKVKKFFIDRKIPRDQRDRIPILVSPEGILWVAGWRTDERFAATEKSRRVLEVRITPAAETGND